MWASKGLEGLGLKIFNFKLEEKLDQCFDVKYDDEPEIDSFKAEKLSHDPFSDPDEAQNGKFTTVSLRKIKPALTCEICQGIRN